MRIIDFFQNCGVHTFNSLFPENIDNKGLVYLINILHIFGVAVIQFGILLPPQYLIYYIIYLVLLLTSYVVFNNKCFMTIISNHYSKKNFNSLCIKMSEAKLILLMYLIVGVIGFVCPKYSLYNILYMYINNSKL